MEHYAGVDYNSPNLSQLRSQISTPTTQGGEDLSYWLSTFVSVGISKTTNRKRGMGERGREVTLCLWIGFLWGMGNHMPELTLTQWPVAGFNSYKMTTIGLVLSIDNVWKPSWRQKSWNRIGRPWMPTRIRQTKNNADHSVSYQWCGSGMFIPYPGSDFFHPGSRIRTFSIPVSGSSSKNLNILTKKIF